MFRREPSGLGGSRKSFAEQMGRQQVVRGRRVQEDTGSQENTRWDRRAQDNQKGAELRVARKAPSSLDFADQSGAGVAYMDRARCGVCGTVVDTVGAAA